MDEWIIRSASLIKLNDKENGDTQPVFSTMDAAKKQNQCRIK